VEFIVHTRLCGFGPSVEDGPEHERDQTRDGKVRELFGELDMATALRRWNGEPPGSWVQRFACHTSQIQTIQQGQVGREPKL
jgi:hypothetical protein